GSGQDSPHAAGRGALAGPLSPPRVHRAGDRLLPAAARSHPPSGRALRGQGSRDEGAGTGLRMGVTWREVEVRRERGEAPTMVLTGRTAAIAQAKGASRILVSLTHDGDYAFAQVMLVGEARNGLSPADR